MTGAASLLLDTSSTINLTTRTVLSISGLASIDFRTDGSIQTNEDGVVTYLTEWLKRNPNTGMASTLEIQRTQVSGTTGVTFTGTFTSGTWYPMTAGRGVSVAYLFGSLRQNISTYSFRRASDAVVLLSGIQITVSSDGR